ncbi:MAG: glycosyltransferase [Candidatus Cloacimonas sp.]|jgi:glycosyltransferase involved in cell wall biosynthesis|nr:glycosyltransferase [Candidatus Cloacimonas sp.]
MKNILFISSYFPPAGGVGVQRLCKFCKYLSRMDYKPFVLTPAAWSVKRNIDSSMAYDLPKNLELINPGFIDLRRLVPGEIAKHFKAWERQHLFPDNMIQWVKVVQKRLPAIIRDHRIDVVYITVPHFSLLKLVSEVKAIADIPVITDLRDPYSFNFYTGQVSDPHYQQRVNMLEQKAFSNSDAILLVTQNIHEEYAQRYPEWKSRFVYLPNGYDDEDYPEQIPDVNSLPNPTLTLCYTGSYSSMASIMPYRDAISDIYQQHHKRIVLKLLAPNKRKRIKRDFKSLIKFNLLDYQGFAPHKQAIAHLLSSHVLLYPVPGFFSGKIYEYFRAQRPILCAMNEERDSHQLIRQAGTGLFVDLNKQDSLTDTLLNLYQQWENKKISVALNWDFIHSFSSQQRTQTLNSLIRSM